ncbi:MAG: miaA [Ramlibacter sp.]|nr:miaA [Ramlibacter sp.]
MPTDALPAVVALAGPTASGKSAASLVLAEALDAEIVSVDSALVYRGMDIGTAKPTGAELARVPHHLVDILDPAERYSAALFAADAQRLVRDIRGRGRRVLLVGGTMLYFKALFEGLDAMPAADPRLRAELEEEAARRGWPALHAELATVDPPTAARLAPNDAQRIQRALEVYRATGTPLSKFHAREAGVPGVTPAYRVQPDLFVSLEPADRSWLHERTSSTRCGRCAHAATCTPNFPACAASATGRRGKRWMARSRWTHCANAASPPPASWPSASSPGCAACRGG